MPTCGEAQTLSYTSSGVPTCTSYPLLCTSLYGPGNYTVVLPSGTCLKSVSPPSTPSCPVGFIPLCGTSTCVCVSSSPSGGTSLPGNTSTFSPPLSTSSLQSNPVHCANPLACFFVDSLPYAILAGVSLLLTTLLLLYLARRLCCPSSTFPFCCCSRGACHTIASLVCFSCCCCCPRSCTGRKAVKPPQALDLSLPPPRRNPRLFKRAGKRQRFVIRSIVRGGGGVGEPPLPPVTTTSPLTTTTSSSSAPLSPPSH